MNEQLFNTIYQWLLTLPSEDEIAKYVLGLPDQNRNIAKEAADRVLQLLNSQKKDYFSQFSCDFFYQELTEDMQLNLMESFVSLNESEIKNALAEKGFSNFASIEIPSGINDWCMKYVRIWRCSCVLYTYSDVINQAILLHSIIMSVKSPEESQVIRKKIELMVQRDLQYIEIGQLQNQNEIDQDRNFLRSLSYFPDVYIDKILDLDYDQQKISLLENLYSLYQLVEDYGVLKAKQEETRLKEILKGNLYLETEANYLNYFEGLRLYNYHNVGHSTEKVLNKLYHLWTSDNVLSSKAFQVTNDYLMNLKPDQKKDFIDLFKDFILHNVLTSVIVKDNIEIELFVKSIDEASNIAELDDLINIAVNDNPDITSFAKKYVRDIWKVIHP